MTTYKQPHCTAAEWRAVQEADGAEAILPLWIRTSKEHGAPEWAIYNEFAVFTVYLVGNQSPDDMARVKDCAAAAVNLCPSKLDGPYICPLSNTGTAHMDVTYYIRPPARKGGRGRQEAV